MTRESHKHNQPVVIQTSLLMLGISVLSTLIAIGNNNLSVQVGESVARDLRDALFLKIQTFSYGNLDRQKTGQLMVRLTSDASALQRLTQISLRIGTRAPLLMIGSLILMINTSPSLALTMLPLLLVTSVVIIFFIVKMEPLFRSVQQKLDRLNTVLQENIAGARLVKAFVRADFEGKRFEAANEDFTDHSVKVMQFMSTMSPALTVFVNIGMVIVIWAGGLQAIQGRPIGRANRGFYQLPAHDHDAAHHDDQCCRTFGPTGSPRPSASMRFWILFQRSRISRMRWLCPTRPRHGSSLKMLPFTITATDDEAVLEDINLVAEPGETVAILGATGAGKSTLINLVPRFYDVSAGRVLIDGMDVRQIQQDSLLAQIGIVPQETILFSGTVRDNIRYGNPQASDEASHRRSQSSPGARFHYGAVSGI